MRSPCDIARQNLACVIRQRPFPKDVAPVSNHQFVVILSWWTIQLNPSTGASIFAFSSSACEALRQSVTHPAKNQWWLLRSKVPKAAGTASKTEVESQPCPGSERPTLVSSPRSRSGRTSGFSASMVTNSRMSTVQAYIS